MNIDLRALSKSFATPTGKVEVFRNLDLSVTSGDFVSILGPNGCGKTTLLNLINGLDKDFEGQIVFQHSQDSRPDFGYMMQRDLLLPWRSVYQNIIIGLELKGCVTKDTRDYVLKYLTRFGIPELIDVFPSRLSGGERQKVALVRTLIIESNILLLDEPFSSIDYNTRLELQGKFYSLVKEAQKTAVLITHDIDEAIAVSDRVVIMNYKPLGILKDFRIDLDVQNRNPLTARQHPKFSSYYSEIWKSLPNNKKRHEEEIT